ncbi:MAG: hypothetical protein JW818_22115 [Pirellulales bacterium]|nr:hypothetical protein [Pirellulales bacterium]
MTRRSSHVGLGLLVSCLVVVFVGGCCLSWPRRPQRFYDPYELMPGCFDNSVACPVNMCDPCAGYRGTCWRSLPPDCDDGCTECTACLQPTPAPAQDEQPSTVRVLPTPPVVEGVYDTEDSPAQTPVLPKSSPVPPSLDGAPVEPAHEILPPVPVPAVEPAPPGGPSKSSRRSAVRLLAAPKRGEPSSTIRVTERSTTVSLSEELTPPAEEDWVDKPSAVEPDSQLATKPDRTHRVRILAPLPVAEPSDEPNDVVVLPQPPLPDSSEVKVLAGPVKVLPGPVKVLPEPPAHPSAKSEQAGKEHRTAGRSNVLKQLWDRLF